MYGSPARLRVEHEAARRTNGAVVISTLLSLLVVVAALAVVAYLVLRAPSSTVDSAERLEPVGTALPAPTEPSTSPTPIPTAEPEPTALGFTGEAPAVTGLPTVAAPREAGPTPTPRVVSLPAAIPPTVVPSPPPLPPSLPVDQVQVPVVALEPVESAPAPAPTAQAVPVQVQVPVDREPTPAPVVLDDDPFNIFSDDNGSGIAPAQNDALDRARALQGGSSRDEDEEFDPVVVPAVDIPEVVLDEDDGPVVTGRDGSVEIVMPDVDAMIDEITARATDPDRNPNVTTTDRASNDRGTTSSGNRRKSARDRINERLARRSTTANSPAGQNDGIPVIEPAGQNNGGNQNQDECEDPFASLPEDMRPENFPFSNC